MKAKRLWWSIRTALTRGGRRRADYARKNNIYAHVGKDVSIQPRVIPVYSELISFHDNVAIARNVDFCTHDIMHTVFNRMGQGRMAGGEADVGDRKSVTGLGDITQHRFSERIGCIEILDNVFVGSNSVILYNTRIGPNVVIASGSVIVKDCEPNSVYAGVPARKVGNLDEFIMKRAVGEVKGTIATTDHNQALTKDEIENAWKMFERYR